MEFFTKNQTSHDYIKLIIPRNYGDVLKNYIQEQNLKKQKEGKDYVFEPIIISIKFSGYNEDGTIEMNLFFSSDNLNAVYFFDEFERYKDALGNQMYHMVEEQKTY